MGYYPDPDMERLVLLEALRDIVLGDDRHVLSLGCCAQMIAGSVTHEDVLIALVDFFSYREPTEAHD